MTALKRIGWRLWIASLVAATYIGLYCALAHRVEGSEVSSLTFGTKVHYGIGHSWLKTIFWPIHQVDRMVRPGFWQTPELQ